MGVQAAREAQAGSALGIDLCAPSIHRARQLARAAKLRNVVFERADAEKHRLPRDHFDVAISRFGTMFFDDSAAAFLNVGRALRQDGRLVMMVWQARERNEWIVAIRRSLGTARARCPTLPGWIRSRWPTRRRDGDLQVAGFTDVAFADVRAPVYYGVDVAAALDWVRASRHGEVLKRLDSGAARAHARRLREAEGGVEDMLDAHASADGVWFDSSSWIVTARRRPSETRGGSMPLVTG